MLSIGLGFKQVKKITIKNTSSNSKVIEEKNSTQKYFHWEIVYLKKPNICVSQFIRSSWPSVFEKISSSSLKCRTSHLNLQFGTFFPKSICIIRSEASRAPTACLHKILSTHFLCYDQEYIPALLTACQCFI